MKKLILIVVIFLTSCAIVTRQDLANTVKIGDSYDIMRAKMGGLPQRVKCLTVSNGEVCTITYKLNTHDYAFFKFNRSDKITSIYR